MDGTHALDVLIDSGVVAVLQQKEVANETLMHADDPGVGRQIKALAPWDSNASVLKRNELIDRVLRTL